MFLTNFQMMLLLVQRSLFGDHCSEASRAPDFDIRENRARNKSFLLDEKGIAEGRRDQHHRQLLEGCAVIWRH